ncbi:MAG: phage major tail tube protein [Gammaproteobacteria bacterium]|nr:phage major tail tube protein [Gammaproteobacteria bacterium]NNJ83487.1 phage major tail tube protein [Gammaproteobacteria bacterium]
MLIPKVIKGFNVFIDGRGYAGRVEEATLPKLSIKMEEFSAGGMDIPIDLDMGMEKLECDMTLAEFDTDTIKLFGLGASSPVSATLRGALDDESGEVVPVTITLKGAWKELDMGSFKGGEKGSLSASMTIRYYKLEIGGEEIVEVDAENMVRKIAGVDQLEKTRAAIGL